MPLTSRILFCLLLILVAGASPFAWGQTVQRVEYYIDTDPGAGSGVAIPASDGSYNSAEESFESLDADTTGLEVGWHSLYVRSRDSFGRWGSSTRMKFEVGQTRLVDSGEYFIDNDPGIGEGQPLTIRAGDRPYRWWFNSPEISTSQLAPGTHELTVRLFNTLGQYTEKRYTIDVWEQTVSGVEYQIQTSPSAGPEWFSGVQPVDGIFDAASEVFATTDFDSTLLPESDRYFVFVRPIDNFGHAGDSSGVMIEVVDDVGSFTPTPSPTPTLTPTPSRTPTPGTPTTTPTSKPEDINRDGFIDAKDLMLLQDEWHRGWREEE